jgi:DNA-binding NtrC family response regulator
MNQTLRRLPPAVRFVPVDVIAPLQAMVEDAERIHIRRALIRCEGSVSKTTELLGVNLKTLWEKMKRLSVSV